MSVAAGLSLKQLEAFVWVADLGSFSRAAARLNTTQPNISARIAALEACLRVRVFLRDAGSVRLTAQGRSLLEPTRQVLRATEDLIEAAGQPDLLDGTLRLGVTELIAQTWLRAYLKALKERFPKMVVELVVDISVKLEKELFEHSIDLALQNEPFERRASGNQELGTYPFVWVRADGISDEWCGRVTTADLISEPVLTPARGTRLYQEIEAHFATAAHVRLVPSSDIAACLHMTLDGMGTAILPEAMVARERAAGRLVQIDYPWRPEPLAFLARYDATRAPGYVEAAAKLASETAREFQQS